MPLNKLDNFIKNTEGRILYVNPNDLDSTDSISNEGNSLTRPFKTIQRAIIESARFSYVAGENNDITEKTTIILFPAEHIVDNRPGWAIYDNNGEAFAVPPSGGVGVPAEQALSLELDSNFDLNQESNILARFNSVEGGVIIPRGTSIVGLDLRKTKVRPLYVPNPTDNTPESAIFRMTGAGYYWQFTFFDGNPDSTVYTNNTNFGEGNKATPLFSHHKLTGFAYADGVNVVDQLQFGNLTDLDMYYAKVGNAYNSFRDISQKFPQDEFGFYKRNPEFQIVGAFASDPLRIAEIISGNGVTASPLVTVTTVEPHGLNIGTPFKVDDVTGPGNTAPYNISTRVQSIIDEDTFTYLIPNFVDNQDLNPAPNFSSATVTIETDTVEGASPYIFNVSLRSVYGLNGLDADGSKATGFRSVVAAQFTAISLQKDDRAFVKYDRESRTYQGIPITPVSGAELTGGSSSTDSAQVFHLDSEAVYRQGWSTAHIKFKNDAFLQLVSIFAIGFNIHFDGQTGADASITNSNSNFGQIALSSQGFKKVAFAKDDTSFLTSIVTPKSIPLEEENIEYISIDVEKTLNEADNSRLYLNGFTNASAPPLAISQGFRIGARVEDRLRVVIDDTERSARILMEGRVSNTDSSFKRYEVTSSPTGFYSNLTIGANNLETGESIIILSEDADLPEGLVANTLYYAIDNGDNNTIQIANSLTDALQGSAITLSGGSELSVTSRVSDKGSGEIGSPIQYDGQNQNNWYIIVDSSDNDIFPNLSGTEPTDLSFVRRISDERSLDEKIYRARVFIPKETLGAKDPDVGFIIQSSSSTGLRTDTDYTRTTIDPQDYDYNRNLRLIADVEYNAGNVTVRSEIPHNLNVNDSIIIKEVKSAANPLGNDDAGFNGTFNVTNIVSDLEFEYQNPVDPGAFIYPEIKDPQFPRFEKNNDNFSFYVYRREIISSYVENESDGIYQLYLLNSGNFLNNGAGEFSDLAFSQPPTDLYPQLDRDNINDNPNSTVSFARRSPIGAVETNDLKRSLTRETINKFYQSSGESLDIVNITRPAGEDIITFDRRHGFGRILGGTEASGGGYQNGVYYNVRLLNNSSDPNIAEFKGATVDIDVTGGGITVTRIVTGGSAYEASDTLFFDATAQGYNNGNPVVLGAGNGNARFDVPAGLIQNPANYFLQFTGDEFTENSYRRILNVVDDTTISVQRVGGPPATRARQFAFVVGPSALIESVDYTPTTGIATFTCSSDAGEYPVGVEPGNSIQITNQNGATFGDFIVEDISGRFIFTANIGLNNNPNSTVGGRAFRKGHSANNAVSDASSENFGVRNLTFNDGDAFTLLSAIGQQATELVINPVIGTADSSRLPLGSYIQLENEIVRVIEIVGPQNYIISRGLFGTEVEQHFTSTLAIKINPKAIEFRRPTFVRASGHTFEYLGYGPGNYSTALPQVQVRNLTEREEFLSQAQERSSGVVAYTGTNNNGDFFIGNKRISSTTGEERNFDIPVPTVTGEDPNANSVIFDEVTVKERILVEGGASGQVLSQFDGPVTFNNTIRFKEAITGNSSLRLTDAVAPFTLDVTGNSNLTGNVTVGGNLVVTGDFDAPDATLDITNITAESGNIGNIQIAVTTPTTIDTTTGELTLGSQNNINLNNATNITGNLSVTGGLDVTAANDNFTITNANTANEVFNVNTNNGNTLIDGQLTVNNSILINAASEIFRIRNGSSTDNQFLVDSDNGDTIINGSATINGGITVFGQGTIQRGPNAGLNQRFQLLNQAGNRTFGVILESGNLTANDISVNAGTFAGNLDVGNAGNLNGGLIQLRRNDGGQIQFFRAGEGTANAAIINPGNQILQINGNLQTTGDITAFVSDDRLKTNKSPIENALSKVNSLNGFTYNHNETASKLGLNTEIKYAGVSAQEVQKVLPEVVKPSPSDENYNTVQYEKLVPLLIEAIKELSEKVTALENQINN